MHVRGRRSFSCAVLFCAFPVLGTSSPKHYLALLLQGIAPPFISDAMLCPSYPRHCPAFLFRCVAVPGQAYRLPCKSWHIYALAAQSLAFPARCGCKHCRSYAAYCISFALLYLAVPIRGISLLCTAPLCPSQAKQCQCLVLLFYSAAVPGYAVQFHACASRRLSARTIACADIRACDFSCGFFV